MIMYYLQIAHFFLIIAGFLGVFLFCAISFFTDKTKVATIVTVIYAVIAIVVGVVYIPKRVHAYEAYKASLTECDKKGHQYATQEYHNVLETTKNIVNVNTDTYYEGALEGKLTGTGNGFIFIYHSTVNATVNGTFTQKEEYEFYYETSDGGYKKASVPVEKATIYYISEGEQPYIEEWTQHGNCTSCAVCGEHEYERETSYYKFFVPKGSIAEDFNID